MQGKTVIFVCTGNTCRSPMAEAVLRSELRRLKIEEVSVFSAGLDPSAKGNINPNSAAVLSENGLSIENFASRSLNGEMLEKAYAIVCMTDSQRDFLMETRWKILRQAGFSEIENNVYSFSDLAGYEIPDPFGKDIGCYRETYRKIAGGMSALIEKLHLFVPDSESTENTEKTERTEEKAGRKPRATPRKKCAPATKKEPKKKTSGTKKKSSEKAKSKARKGNANA